MTSPHDDDRADLMTMSRVIGEEIIYVEMAVYPCGCSKLLRVCRAPQLDPDEDTEMTQDEVAARDDIGAFTWLVVCIARGVMATRIQAAGSFEQETRRRPNLRELNS